MKRLLVLVGSCALVLGHGVSPWAQEESEAKAKKAPVEIPDVDTTGMKKESLDALRHAQDDVRANPARAGNWARLGALFDARQLFEEAERCYAEAARIAPKSFDYAYMRARVADIVGGEIDAVLALYATAEKLDPYYPPLHLHRGNCFGRYGRLDEARQAFSKALALKADYPAAELGLGQALLNLGEAEQALTHLLKAAAKAPEERAVNTALARAYMQTGKPELARKVAERTKAQSRGLDDQDRVRDEVLNQASSSHDAMHRAEHAMAEGRFADAIPDIQDYLRGRPGSTDVRYSLAYALYHTGQVDEALQECLRISEEDPDLLDAKVLIAQIYLNRPRKKSEEALRLLSEVLRKDGTNFVAMLMMANELSSLGQADQAVRIFERAYAEQELNAQSHHSWGVSLLQLERVEEASQHLRAATVLDPKFAMAHFNLGYSLGLQGRWDAAIRAYEEAAKVNPGLPTQLRIEELRKKQREEEEDA